MGDLGRIIAVRGRVTAVPALVSALVASQFERVSATPAAVQDSPTIETRVKVVHAAPALSKVEVHINYVEVLDEFTYGQESDWIDVPPGSGYSVIPPGSAYVVITTDRAGFNYAVLEAVHPVPAGNDYSLIITDTLLLGGSFDLNPLPDGEARVRIVHASVALPAVNVQASESDVSFATGLRYPLSSDAIAVPGGTYAVEVTLADSGESVLTAPAMVLDGNTTYELVLMGQPGDGNHPLELRPLSDSTRENATPTP